MKIIVDADACPVKDIIEEVARVCNLEVILVANINHSITSDYARVVVVDNNSQAADLAIINLTCRGDIIITQDYGLASIVLTKGSSALDPSGKRYTADNIEGLLTRRYLNQKARRAGLRTSGPRKRSSVDNSMFKQSLSKLIMEHQESGSIY